MLISTTTTKSQNVAPNGTDVTVKYLSFCQDSRTPNRFLAGVADKIAWYSPPQVCTTGTCLWSSSRVLAGVKVLGVNFRTIRVQLLSTQHAMHQFRVYTPPHF